jgi:hypothetical protein
VILRGLRPSGPTGDVAADWPVRLQSGDFAAIGAVRERRIAVQSGPGLIMLVANLTNLALLRLL